MTVSTTLLPLLVRMLSTIPIGMIRMMPRAHPVQRLGIVDLEFAAG